MTAFEKTKPGRESSLEFGVCYSCILRMCERLPWFAVEDRSQLKS